MTNPDPGDVDFADLLARLHAGSAYAADFADQHYAAVKAAAPEDRPRVLAEWREQATFIAEQAILIRAGIADWIDAEAAGMAAEAMAAAQPEGAGLMDGGPDARPMGSTPAGRPMGCAPAARPMTTPPDGRPMEPSPGAGPMEPSPERPADRRSGHDKR